MQYLPFLLVFLTFFSNNIILSQNTVSGKSKQVESSLLLDQTLGLGIEVKPLASSFYFEGEAIKRREFVSIIRTNRIAHRKYIIGTNLRVFGNLVAIPSLIATGMIYFINGYAYDGGEKPDLARGKLSAGLFFTGVMMTVAGRFILNSSVDAFNGADKFGLDLGLQAHGVGVAFRF